MQTYIRDVKLEDAQELLDIYAPYVLNTAITFEYEVPSLTEFQNRISNITKKYPYLVIEQENDSRDCNSKKRQIVGYAYACAFHPRAAYEWCVELAIYLNVYSHGNGYGRMLYEALEERLKAMHILNLYACIAIPQEEDEYLTFNSANFHEHLGFKNIGTFSNCGYKFDRWYHMCWMEKFIGVHCNNQEKIIPYHNLSKSNL